MLHRSVRNLPAAAGDAFVQAEVGAHAGASSQHNTLRPPTEGQAAAGNYKLGAVPWRGLTLRIENPRGSQRSGTSPDGSTWCNTMAAHYGYVAGTRGADGDAVDVFLGPVPESDAVWVVNQNHADGSFDEHKLLLGFNDAAQARNAYLFSYDRGWNRIRSIVRLTPDQLGWWLDFADTSRELTLDLVPPAGPEKTIMDSTTAPPLARVYWDASAQPRHQTLGDVIYMLRRNDAAEGLLLDSVSMGDITEGAIFDALVVEAGRLQPKMEALQRVMTAAGGDVKPVSMQLSDPLKRNGGVHVAALFELSDGQTVTIWFHNPDMTPAKFSPADELVSWKWLLNKRDITIVVAPESGQDLNTRDVARRIMRLAEKNSAAFQKANVKRAATLAENQTLKDTLTERQAELANLHGEIEVAKAEKEERDARFDPATAEGYAKIAGDDAALQKHQDSLDSAFGARIVDVRNALRALGWTGGNFGAGDASMRLGDAKVTSQLTHTGAGRNVVGVTWTLAASLKPGVDAALRDDFSMEPAAIAKELTDRLAPAPAVEPTLADFQARAEYIGGELLDSRNVLELAAMIDDAGTVGGATPDAIARPVWVAGQAIAHLVSTGRLDSTLGLVAREIRGKDAASVIAQVAEASGTGSLNDHAEAFKRLMDERRAALTPVPTPTPEPAAGDLIGDLGSAPPPPATLSEALKAGNLALATEMLTGMSVDEAKDALLNAGFAMGAGLKDMTALLSFVQGALVRAANAKVDGYGLRELDKTPVQEPAPAAENESLATLRDVLAGKFDTEALAALLDRIEANVKALDAAGLLQGEADTVASGAITHWVELDEKVNG